MSDIEVLFVTSIDWDKTNEINREIKHSKKSVSDSATFSANFASRKYLK